jgi:hypothetical protein
MRKLSRVEEYIVQILADGEFMTEEILMEIGEEQMSIYQINGSISSLMSSGLVKTRRKDGMRLISLTSEGVLVAQAIYNGQEYWID